MSKDIELSIRYELEASNVKESDIDLILEKVKNRLSEENIDIELEKLGYPKVFTADYESYDEYDFLDIEYIDWDGNEKINK